MADLIPTPPLTRNPLETGGARLSLHDPGPLHQIALYPGAELAAAVLLAPLGLDFPAPGRMAAAGGLRLVWTGRAQAMLVGAEPPQGLTEHAALTDQSDGWVCLSLAGPGAEAVLARLVPLDLRAAAFPPGHAARTALNHMPLILWREAEDFRLMTFRSMARTAWDEIAHAMAHLAARAAAARAP